MNQLVIFLCMSVCSSQQVLQPPYNHLHSHVHIIYTTTPTCIHSQTLMLEGVITVEGETLFIPTDVALSGGQTNEGPIHMWCRKTNNQPVHVSYWQR